MVGDRGGGYPILRLRLEESHQRVEKIERSRMEGGRGQGMDLITDYVASSHEKYNHIQVYKQVEVEIGKGRSRNKPKKGG